MNPAHSPPKIIPLSARGFSTGGEWCKTAGKKPMRQHPELREALLCAARDDAPRPRCRPPNCKLRECAERTEFEAAHGVADMLYLHGKLPPAPVLEDLGVEDRKRFERAPTSIPETRSRVMISKRSCARDVCAVCYPSCAT